MIDYTKPNTRINYVHPNRKTSEVKPSTRVLRKGETVNLSELARLNQR